MWLSVGTLICMGKALGLILGYLYLYLSLVIYIILGVLVEISRTQLLTHPTPLLFSWHCFQKTQCNLTGCIGSMSLCCDKTPIKQLKQGRKVSTGGCGQSSQGEHGPGAGGNWRKLVTLYLVRNQEWWMLAFKSLFPFVGWLGWVFPPNKQI